MFLTYTPPSSGVNPLQLLIEEHVWTVGPIGCGGEADQPEGPSSPAHGLLRGSDPSISASPLRATGLSVRWRVPRHMEGKEGCVVWPKELGVRTRWQGLQEEMGAGLKRGVEGAGSKEAGTCIGSWVP